MELEDTSGYLFLRNKGYSRADALRLLEKSINRPNDVELHERRLDGIVLHKETGLDRL